MYSFALSFRAVFRLNFSRLSPANSEIYFAIFGRAFFRLQFSESTTRVYEQQLSPRSISFWRKMSTVAQKFFSFDYCKVDREYFRV